MKGQKKRIRLDENACICNGLKALPTILDKVDDDHCVKYLVEWTHTMCWIEARTIAWLDVYVLVARYKKAIVDKIYDWDEAHVLPAYDIHSIVKRGPNNTCLVHWERYPKEFDSYEKLDILDLNEKDTKRLKRLK